MKAIVTIFAFLAFFCAVLETAPTAFVCYFGSWSVYRPSAGKFDVENIDPNLCTHLIFGFAALDNNTMDRIISYDPWNELYDNGGKGAYLRFTGLKKQNPNLKTLLAIGGWNEGSSKYSQMAASPTKRANFIQSVLDFLPRYGFDGLDFDWEYPGMRGGNPAIDKANFIAILQELKAALSPRGYLLTAAVSPGKDTIDVAYDIPALSNILDQIHIMGYDYHGAWETVTGINSPLYGNDKYDVGYEATLNVEWTVNHYISNGANPSKLILGIPTYGRGFTLDDAKKNYLKAPASNPIPGGPYTRENGSWSYLEICTKLRTEQGWNIIRDNCYGSPYAYNGLNWIGYDDPQSVTLKAQFAAAKNLGGTLVWTIDYDDVKGECTGESFGLMKTIKRTMMAGANAVPPKCGAFVDSTTAIMTTNTAPPTVASTTSAVQTTVPISVSTTAVPSSTTVATSGTQCGTQSSTSTAAATAKTSTTMPTTPVPTGSTQIPSPICKRDGLNVYPGNCSLFNSCVSNGLGGWILYTMKCPDGTVFSEDLLVCVKPRSGFICPPA